MKAADILADVFLKAPVIFTAYFVLINIAAFLMYFADKRKAVNHKWRIPEATLILFGFMGGSFGAFAAMQIFRHKTKHAKFVILIPLFMLLHLAVIVTVVIGIDVPIKS